MNDDRHSFGEDLLDALDHLTLEHMVTTKLEDGTKHHEKHEGLIKQLRNAIASSLGGAAGGKAAHERIPLDADALTKYNQIEDAILERFADARIGTPELLPEVNLRRWYVAFIATATEQAITNEWRTLAQWQTIIEEKLSPPTIRELAGEECPECSFAWYDTVLNAAKPATRRPDDQTWNWVDKERKPALTVTYRPDDMGGLTASFAKCGNCNHVWIGSSGIRALAYTIEHRHEEIAG